MRMEWTQMQFEANGEGRLGHALVQLKKVRMPATDTNPDNFGWTFRRERPKASYRQEKKSAEMNRAKSFAKFCIDILRHVAKETEREMHLFGGGPPDAANLWIKIDKKPLD